MNTLTEDRRSQKTKLPDHSWWKEAAIVISLATIVMQMVSFLSPFWGVPRTREYDPKLEGIGLWKYCRIEKEANLDKHVCINMESNQPTFLMTTQALTSMGVAFTMLAFIIVTASECIKSLRQKPKLLFVFIGLCFGAAVFSASGVLVFGLDIETQPLEEADGTAVYMKVGWCFGLAVAAVFLQCICGIVGICELMFTPRRMESVEIKVLNFSVSFPGSLTMVAASQSSSARNADLTGFENINFEHAIVGRLDDESET